MKNSSGGLPVIRGKGWLLQVLKVLALYLSLTQFSNLFKFSNVGGKGQDSGTEGGSSLFGQEQIPESSPTQGLELFISVFFSIKLSSLVSVLSSDSIA